MTSTTTFAGIALTSVLFISLFGMVALIMNSAMAHTDTMLQNIGSYTANPTEENRDILKKSIDDTDNFMKDISSVSAEYLKRYLDTVDTSVLNENEKESIIEAKKMLDRIETKDPSDPDAIRLKKNLEDILSKLDDSN
ncbi:MAG: hypothetical protein ABIG84_02930 [archaeon]